MKIGSLFSGYGGLDMAVSDVFGADLAWHVEFDKAPSAILAHHWPDVPNYGDVTSVDWSTVEPIDIITGGFPCQDLSHAGKRAGLREGTRSGLWSYMAEAVNVLQPDLVVIENVLGILSARAASDVEPCPMCLGDNTDSVMRALGTVCSDLAEIGFDARWTTFRAADAGACHGRARVFIIAYPSNAQHFESQRIGELSRLRSRSDSLADLWLSPQKVDLLPTPKASDGPNGGPGMRNGRGEIDALPAIADLLPTPDASAAKYRLGGGSQQSRSLEAPARRGEFAANANRSGCSEHGRAKSMDEEQPAAEHSCSDVYGGHAVTDFGVYGPAVARWADVIGRPAPSPTEPGKNGPRLSPAFVEWMMGLPIGHVTDEAIGLSRSQQLKALGNGVVPQQAAKALRQLLGVDERVSTDSQLLPTPTSQAAKHSSLAPIEREGNRPQGDHNLWVVAARMGEQLPNGGGLLPTPTPFQLDNKETPAQWLTRRKDVVKRTGTHHGLPLPVAAVSISEGKPIALSNPTASEAAWGVSDE